MPDAPPFRHWVLNKAASAVQGPPLSWRRQTVSPSGTHFQVIRITKEIQTEEGESGRGGLLRQGSQEGLSGEGASEQRLKALLVQAGLPQGPVSSASSCHSCAEPVAQQAVWAPGPCLAGPGGCSRVESFTQRGWGSSESPTLASVSGRSCCRFLGGTWAGGGGHSRGRVRPGAPLRVWSGDHRPRRPEGGGRPAPGGGSGRAGGLSSALGWATGLGPRSLWSHWRGHGEVPAPAAGGCRPSLRNRRVAPARALRPGAVEPGREP